MKSTKQKKKKITKISRFPKFLKHYPQRSPEVRKLQAASIGSPAAPSGGSSSEFLSRPESSSWWRAAEAPDVFGASWFGRTWGDHFWCWIGVLAWFWWGFGEFFLGVEKKELKITWKKNALRSRLKWRNGKKRIGRSVSFKIWQGLLESYRTSKANRWQIALDLEICSKIESCSTETWDLNDLLLACLTRHCRKPGCQRVKKTWKGRWFSVKPENHKLQKLDLQPMSLQCKFKTSHPWIHHFK